VTPFGQKLRDLRADRGLAEALQRLADLSHPRVTVDTAGLTPEATELANVLAEKIHGLSAEQVEDLLTRLKRG
jgi:hypothetical protein